MNIVDHFDQKVESHQLIVIIARYEFQRRKMDAFRQNDATLENQNNVSLCQHRSDLPYASAHVRLLLLNQYNRCKRGMIVK